MGSRKGAVIAEKLSTDKEFDAFLSKSGLIVIDTYQAWCGPCKPVQVVFKKLKTDIGPAKIHFGLADVDKIEKLEDYRGVNGGGCEPLFLFFAGGKSSFLLI
jgi:thiol-disulfide isomerase/thioredoxin